MRYFCSILLIFSFFIVRAQRIDNPWIMGYDCCHPNFSGMDLNFSSGSLQITAVPRMMNFATTTAQISDGYGTMLFYSNGVSVSNRNDQLMMNGDGLSPSTYTTNHAQDGLVVSQAQIVIPFPGDSTKYYLFHETSDDFGNTNTSFYLYYSIIDMTLDNGLGAVVQKNTILLNDTLVPGQLTACKHANGRDWWLVTQRYFSFDNYSFLITPNGISGPFTQNVGAYRGAGQPVFSPDGSKFAMYSPYNLGVDIWDFDRCTGLFSNHYNIDLFDTAYSAGTAFSASGRYLYVSSYLHMYQFDMEAADIGLSKINVGDYDGFISFAPTTFYFAVLAPDNKIYITTGSSTKHLHVINYPDSAGLSCDFCQHCIQLPAYTIQTMPNHPNYYLGPLTGSACDTLVSGLPAVYPGLQSFNVFPNPAGEFIFISMQSMEKMTDLTVYNSSGQKLQCKDISIESEEYLKVNISGLPRGLYSVEMVSKNGRAVKRFVKE